MTTKTSLKFLGFVLLSWFLVGGEGSTRVSIKGGTTPVSDLSGSGAVAVFTVFGPDFMTKAEKPLDENFAVWKIGASGGYLNGTRIRYLRNITYGVVPEWYVQIKPKEGTPPPLIEGQRYFYAVETTNAAGASGYFEIRDSPAVPTIGSGPCFLDDHGKTVRVPCPKILAP